MSDLMANSVLFLLGVIRKRQLMTANNGKYGSLRDQHPAGDAPGPPGGNRLARKKAIAVSCGIRLIESLVLHEYEFGHSRKDLFDALSLRPNKPCALRADCVERRMKTRKLNKAYIH
jgi:hypothetical protein